MVEIKLNLTTLWGAATIMRQRRDVYYLRDLDAGGMDCADSGLTSITRTLDVDLDLAETEVEGNFGTVGGCCLCRVGSILLVTPEIHLTCAGPGDSLTLEVSEGYYYVIERGVDVSLALSLDLDYPFLLCAYFLSHDSII